MSKLKELEEKISNYWADEEAIDGCVAGLPFISLEIEDYEKLIALAKAAKAVSTTRRIMDTSWASKEASRWLDPVCVDSQKASDDLEKALKALEQE